MKQLFVPYNIAILAKEKGFNKPCLGYWSNWGEQEPFLLTCEYNTEKESCSIRRKNLLCSAPLYQQLQDWFREKHNLHLHIDTTSVFDKMQGSMYKATLKVPFQPFKWTTGHYYLGKTYYEALNKALTEAFKLI